MLHCVPPSRLMFVACACMVVSAAGCTMCPDPYDYSGPVPNGSAPQNDFRARSNGILPLDAAAKPFPTVVKAPTRPAPTVAPTDEKPKVAEAEDDVLRLSAETPVPETDTDEASAAIVVAEESPAAAGELVADSAGQEVVDDEESPPPAPLMAGTVPEPMPQPVPVAAEPALRETPGWRARR